MTTLPQIRDAKTHEQQKTELARAQDIAYTINHAIVCTAADFLSIPINTATQRMFGASPVGCNNPHHNHASDKRSWKNLFGHVTAAELLADFIAVPITVTVQRLLPGLMHGISKTVEPLFGDLFRAGAGASSKLWARKHGLDPNGPEALEKARTTYNHEAEHLGQAVMWTATAFGLNVGIQYGTETWKPPIGGRTKLSTLISAKGIGSTISSAALIGLRGFGPSVAENWDDWTSKHVFIPATRKVSHWFGVSNEALDRFEKKETDEDKHWDNVIAKAKAKKASAEESPAPVVSEIA